MSIEYADPVACGRVEWGVEDSRSKSTFTTRGDGRRVDIGLSVEEKELPREEIESALRCHSEMPEVGTAGSRDVTFLASFLLGATMSGADTRSPPRLLPEKARPGIFAPPN